MNKTAARREAEHRRSSFTFLCGVKKINYLELRRKAVNTIKSTTTQKEEQQWNSRIYSTTADKTKLKRTEIDQIDKNSRE